MYARCILIALLFWLTPILVSGQSFNYSYVDPCTGVTKTINVPSNGVTVTYYGQIKTFSTSAFYSGEFESWAQGVYSSFGNNNPCASIVGLPTGINIAQNTAINFLSIMNSLSAISDLTSMSGGGATNILSGVGSMQNSQEKKNSKKDKSASQNNTQTQGGQNVNSQNTEAPNQGQTQPTGQQTNSGAQGQNPVTGTQGQSTPGSGSNGQNSVQGNQTNQSNNTQGQGSQSSGQTPVNNNSQGQPTNQQNTNTQQQNGNNNNSSSNTSGGSGTSGNVANNPQSTSGQSGAGTNGTQQGGSKESPAGNQQNGGNAGSEQSSTNQNQNSNSTNANGNTTPGSNGQSQGNGSESNQGQSGGQNGQQVNGLNSKPASPPNQSSEKPNTEEQGKTDLIGGSVSSIGGSSNPGNKNGNRPNILASSDLVGFNFKNSDLNYGGKFTGGYTSLRWDGLRSHGFLIDYTTALKGPNITGFYAFIRKKRIDLISATATIGFDTKPTAYGTLALGQMWNIGRSNRLKAVYMLTGSFGSVYGAPFIGTAGIVGGTYDWKISKRLDVKIMGLYVYAPYVSYYNDILLKSPHVVLPIIGTNIGITKRFKININGGGAWAIKENALNYTVMMGTRLLL